VRIKKWRAQSTCAVILASTAQLRKKKRPPHNMELFIVEKRYIYTTLHYGCYVVSNRFNDEEFDGIVQIIIRQSRTQEDHMGTKG